MHIRFFEIQFCLTVLFFIKCAIQVRIVCIAVRHNFCIKCFQIFKFFFSEIISKLSI